MTTDERLDRLTERTDALAQTVELLTLDIKDMSKQMDSRFAETLHFINQLARVAEARERRIDKLEDGPQ